MHIIYRKGTNDLFELEYPLGKTWDCQYIIWKFMFFKLITLKTRKLRPAKISAVIILRSVDAPSVFAAQCAPALANAIKLSQIQIRLWRSCWTMGMKITGLYLYYLFRCITNNPNKVFHVSVTNFKCYGCDNNWNMWNKPGKRCHILRWVSHLKTWEMMMNLLVFYYSIKNPNRIIQIVSKMYNLDFRLTLNRQDNSWKSTLFPQVKSELLWYNMLPLICRLG